MNGAESLVHTLLNAGIDTCFTNPGTSEMHFVAALDRIEGMHCVLGLQENVVTGMADGYFRIAKKPAATLLHCGPGLANGLANLHNARRAGSAIVNIVGDQATYHRPFDPPLTADTSALAQSVSHWVRTPMHSEDVGQDAASAIQAAQTYPGQIATLILPSDASWNEGGVVATAKPPLPTAPLDPFAIENAARILRNNRNVLILLGDEATFMQGQKLAWRIAQKTGAELMETFVNGRLQRGRGFLPLRKVPYAMDSALKALEPYDHIILVNAKEPVGFFAYPGKPSIQYRKDAQIHTLSRKDQDCIAALQALANLLEAPEIDFAPATSLREPSYETINSAAVAATIAQFMPENSIIADESISYGRDFAHYFHQAPDHDLITLTGGAIGNGLPLATGAAIGGGKQRRVIGLQADGSGMYTLQSLWTQARENLPVTTIILANKRYNILLGEYHGVGATPGKTAMDMLDLGNPDLDWVKLANGMGVEGAKANTMAVFADLLRQSFKNDAPFVIELMI